MLGVDGPICCGYHFFQQCQSSHVCFHKPAVSDRFPGREDPPPTPITVGEETELEVKAILECRKCILLSERDTHLKKIHVSPRKIFMPPGYYKNSSTETLRKCHFVLLEADHKRGHCQGTSQKIVAHSH